MKVKGLLELGLIIGSIFILAGCQLMENSTTPIIQSPDNSFVPSNTKKTFSAEERPIVFIDQAHHNSHTMDGDYKPFAKVLESDGYIVKKNTQKFTNESLKKCDILVIANALNKKNIVNWNLPNYSAFQRDEVVALYHWVKNGGSLFLIVDHMPFPKASEPVAAIFGFALNNGLAKDYSNKDQIFSTAKGNLIENPILKGMNSSERVNSVRAFTGSAFLASPANAKPLLAFTNPAISYMPTKQWDGHWNYKEITPRISINKWNQGATLEFHKGRIVVFGESAMFTSQYVNVYGYVGLKSKGAEQNEQFLLNIMHWLSHKIK